MCRCGARLRRYGTARDWVYAGVGKPATPQHRELRGVVRGARAAVHRHGLLRRRRPAPARQAAAWQVCNHALTRSHSEPHTTRRLLQGMLGCHRECRALPGAPPAAATAAPLTYSHRLCRHGLVLLTLTVAAACALCRRSRELSSCPLQWTSRSPSLPSCALHSRHRPRVSIVCRGGSRYGHSIRRKRHHARRLPSGLRPRELRQTHEGGGQRFHTIVRSTTSPFRAPHELVLLSSALLNSTCAVRK